MVLLAWGAWWLGEWQFGRLDERQARNEIIRSNEARDPAPVDEVLAPDEPVADDEEYRLVTATGTYDAANSVIVRYRSGPSGEPGVDVVVPLVTEAGTALVVDRGFLPIDTRSADIGEVPAPPSGEVTITGYVRANGTGDSTEVDDLSTRAINSEQIEGAIGRTTYGGFVDLASETPEPDESLVLADLPELDDGPHFFYGLQWWFFGLLAIFGFGFLAYDEVKRGPRGQRPHSPRPGPAAGEAPTKVRRTNVPAAYQRKG